MAKKKKGAMEPRGGVTPKIRSALVARKEGRGRGRRSNPGGEQSGGDVAPVQSRRKSKSEKRGRQVRREREGWSGSGVGSSPMRAMEPAASCCWVQLAAARA